MKLIVGTKSNDVIDPITFNSTGDPYCHNSDDAMMTIPYTSPPVPIWYVSVSILRQTISNPQSGIQYSTFGLCAGAGSVIFLLVNFDRHVVVVVVVFHWICI